MLDFDSVLMKELEWAI